MKNSTISSAFFLFFLAFFLFEFCVVRTQAAKSVSSEQRQRSLCRQNTGSEASGTEKTGWCFSYWGYEKNYMLQIRDYNIKSTTSLFHSKENVGATHEQTNKIYVIKDLV